MKRKILSAFLVLVLLCMPMLCFTGCGADASGDTYFELTSTSQFSVAKGTSLSSVTTFKVKLDYKMQKWHPEKSEWQYVVENKDDNDGSTAFDYSGTSAVWFYGESHKEFSLADALSMGMSEKGWNTTTATSTPRTLTLTYGGISRTIQYTVTETAGGGE